MWARVLKSLYGSLDVGESCIITNVRLDRGSSWWKSIIENILEESGKWLWGNLERGLGNGVGTSFWESCWVDGETLKGSFPRLYHLSALRETKISEMRE